MKIIISIISVFLTINVFACECQECQENCNFYNVSRRTDVVILGKIKSFNDFDEETLNPNSMIIEIIKVYKGQETRKEIKVWNGVGGQCRDYLNNFKLDSCYLMAPQKINSKIFKNETIDDFEFSSCIVDFLKVDFIRGIAIGEYKKKIFEIELDKFEKELR